MISIPEAKATNPSTSPRGGKFGNLLPRGRRHQIYSPSEDANGSGVVHARAEDWERGWMHGRRAIQSKDQTSSRCWGNQRLAILLQIFEQINIFWPMTIVEGLRSTPQQGVLDPLRRVLGSTEMSMALCKRAVESCLLQQLHSAKWIAQLSQSALLPLKRWANLVMESGCDEPS